MNRGRSSPGLRGCWGLHARCGVLSDLGRFPHSPNLLLINGATSGTRKGQGGAHGEKIRVLGSLKSYTLHCKLVRKISGVVFNL